MTEELIEPVAWRYRYLHPGRVNHWIVRQSPAVSSEASSGMVAVEAEPLYSATTVQSLSARVAELEGLAGALIAKLDECAPHIANAFAMEDFRDRPYSGPQYRDELNALRNSLTKEAVVDG